MKLIFIKDEEENIIVKFKDGDKKEEFSYSEMVKRLYDERIIETAELEGDFSPEEEDSINKLVEEIKKVILSKTESLEDDIRELL